MSEEVKFSGRFILGGSSRTFCRANAKVEGGDVMRTRLERRHGAFSFALSSVALALNATFSFSLSSMSSFSFSVSSLALSLGDEKECLLVLGAVSVASP